MKLSKTFNTEMIYLQRLNAATLHFCQQNEVKIPKLAGFQKFVKHYNRMSDEEKIKFAPELKRRLIRQQYVFNHPRRSAEIRTVQNFVCMPYEETFTTLFQRLNAVSGSRHVKLTPGLSTICR
jgi:RNase P subunit RPR2